MPIFVDNAAILYKGKLRYHLSANTLLELHLFCRQISVNRCWFHAGSAHPHYDITGQQRKAAIEAGAKVVDSKELVLIAKGLVPGRCSGPELPLC